MCYVSSQRISVRGLLIYTMTEPYYFPDALIASGKKAVDLFVLPPGGRHQPLCHVTVHFTKSGSKRTNYWVKEVRPAKDYEHEFPFPGSERSSWTDFLKLSLGTDNAMKTDRLLVREDDSGTGETWNAWMLRLQKKYGGQVKLSLTFFCLLLIETRPTADTLFVCQKKKGKSPWLPDVEEVEAGEAEEEEVGNTALLFLDIYSTFVSLRI